MKKQGESDGYQNYIFDLYGTLVDIHTNEKKASLWKNMACMASMMGAAYTAEEFKRQYHRLCRTETERKFPLIKAEYEDKYRSSKSCIDKTDIDKTDIDKTDIGKAEIDKIDICQADVEIQLEAVFYELFRLKGIELSKEQLRQFGIAFRSLSFGYLKLFEGVPELFCRLKAAGKKIYLLSNAQRMFTEPEMRMLGIYDCFDGILYSSDAGVKKPSFYFFDALFKRYGLKKEESVMIGNEYRADIQGADSYGIDSMYVFTLQSGKRPEVLPESCREIGTIGEVF